MSADNPKEKYEWRPQTLDQMIDGYSEGKISPSNLPDFIELLETMRHRLTSDQRVAVSHLLYYDQTGANPSQTTVT
ncbi:MAG: hypothetical protein QF741_03525 [Candidatus Peribacteraceae bacterium]|jgi:hypothetical protein|nr:hypothetical protein [Candidatus Peribacteraceae bacterium]MDP7454335.1 hypothetical protein [Candidatus Peribacteraceae bacterium]MDP7645733.1 hypothetical protein [Candidatus Peribacteraceae bacterium]|tara:strand:+ start:1335 stop:1562 length:228 start_codon:yes stop_codon:yes gene_type:complete